MGGGSDEGDWSPSVFLRLVCDYLLIPCPIEVAEGSGAASVPT